MDDVRIAILSSADIVCAFMDNSAPEALRYYDDELHEYLEGSAYTFSFSASAKHESSQYLIEGNKLSFVYRNKSYYLNIMKVIRDEYTVDVEAYGLSLELLNEYTGAYSAAQAMTFEEYLEAFNFADDILTIGINEVSNKSIKNEWTGESTILARIFSLATVFSAEVEFSVELNNDYSLKGIILNVYKAHDDTKGIQGIGQSREDITLRYGLNIEGITKTSDINDLYTAIRPTGKDGLTVASLNKTEYDENGNVLYQSPTGDINIYAVQACAQFPSNSLAAVTDRYICTPWSYDTDNAEVLYGQALAQLKANSVPKITYDIKGYFDTDIGDTVQVTDEEYNPPLYLSARVTEQIRSFTDPSRNSTTFSNVKEEASQVDPTLLARMEELVNANRSYTCEITTDNGIVFKDSSNNTTLTATIRDAGADITDHFAVQWYKDGAAVTSGAAITVTAEQVVEKAVYRAEAVDSSGTVRAAAEVTLTRLADGEDAILLTIESSNGNTFKNSDISTTLTVNVIIGDEWITDNAALKEKIGASAYLQWEIKKYGQTDFTEIPSSDERLSDGGFIFTISPDDIDVKATFNCKLYT